MIYPPLPYFYTNRTDIWLKLRNYSLRAELDTNFNPKKYGDNKFRSTSLFFNSQSLIQVDLFRPHFCEGLMFWTDGESRQVMKSTLEGTQCVALVASKLFRPAGITLNRWNKLVFWANYFNDTIETVGYGGNNRRVLFRSQRYSRLWGSNLHFVAFIL